MPMMYHPLIRMRTLLGSGMIVAETAESTMRQGDAEKMKES
jgi:hypothetical protein